jgi:nicotinate-nucleotide pyrophosphorylase (carboxylating)
MTTSDRAIAPPDPAAVERVVCEALAEDLSAGDPTTEGLVDPGICCTASLLLKEPGIVCGLPLVEAVFKALNKGVRIVSAQQDGDVVTAPALEVARITGSARAILSGERTALNLLGRLSGIATLAAQYVAAVEGTGVVILDTRKTTPGLRALEKYAVRAGGATNHRHHLGEALLVKDNHLRLAGGIPAAASRLRAVHPELVLEIEADSLDDVRAALETGADRILLDNMPLDQIREAVRLCAGRVPLEASGGVTLATVRAIAETGVGFISIGALTHAARSLDVSLEVW